MYLSAKPNKTLNVAYNHLVENEQIGRCFAGNVFYIPTVRIVKGSLKTAIETLNGR